MNMPRMPELAREQLPEDKRHVWDEIVASRGFVRWPFSAMIHSPELAGRAAHLGAFVRFESSLDPQVRELATLITARLMDCDYEYAAHARQGRELGLRGATLTALEQRRLDEAAEEDRWLVELVQQIVLKHRVEEATYRSCEQRLGLNGLVELVGTVGYYLLLAATLNTFEISP